MITYKYKNGFIHDNFTSGMIQVQVDAYAYSIQVKSIHAAKIIITRFERKN